MTVELNSMLQNDINVYVTYFNFARETGMSLDACFRVNEAFGEYFPGR